MVTFTHLPHGALNVNTQTISGVQAKPKPLPSIGMDTTDFHKQVLDLVNKKLPIQKAYEAIDKHPEITDKPRAKSMAEAIYQIAG